MKETEFKYGKPASPVAAKPKKRLPQYDEALEEFLKSGYNNWEVNLEALPSKKPRVVLSSLKWRIKNKIRRYAAVATNEIAHYSFALLSGFRTRIRKYSYPISGDTFFLTFFKKVFIDKTYYIIVLNNVDLSVSTAVLNVSHEFGSG